MFLKRKRGGKFKARGCVDGRPQRDYMTKEESASPTVATEALLISCVIDAIEKRDIATADIPGAFMQSNMKSESGERVTMKLEGLMAQIMSKIDPNKYEKYVVIENGKPVIYAIMEKALYGTLQAALLFYENLSEQLKEWGFKINPYDFCVANKTINGKQCTIVWHVDDLKISHVDANVVTDILKQLDEKYGQEIVNGKKAGISITRGKIHDYLGMTLDYTEDGFVKIDMVEYIAKCLADLPERMQGKANTPAADDLFIIDVDSELLDKKGSEFFHSKVAQILFLGKRGRPDLLTAISFLCTRVKSPTKQDDEKLCRVMKYMASTSDLMLRLRADKMNIIKW